MSKVVLIVCALVVLATVTVLDFSHAAGVGRIVANKDGAIAQISKQGSNRQPFM